MSGTVSSSIDFDKRGKQSGYLQAGDSTNNSGWAMFNLPIHSINSGAGPKVLIIGGNHGDEYEGQFAIANLIRELGANDISGELIAIPSVSFLASFASTRLWADETNFNRIFPGDENGRIPQKIAHYLATELIPRVDVVIDIHSGGRGHHFLESATATWSADKSYRSDLLKNLNGWNTRYSLIFPSHPGTNEQSLLPGHVASLGKSLFTGEFGGSGITTATSNRITRAALISALKSVSLLKPDFQSKGYDHQIEISSREFIDMRSSDTYHWAEEEGIYQNKKRLGERVEKGEVIGAIHFPESADRKPHLVIAAKSGTVGVIRGYPRVKRGDCLTLIGDSYSDLSQLPE